MDGRRTGTGTAVAAAAVVLALLAAAPLLVVFVVFAGAGGAQALTSGCGPGTGEAGGGGAGPGGQQAGNVRLDAEQLANASTIMAVTGRRGLPAYAAVVAVATAYQESKLYNLGYGDRDSLGLFQQRPSQGWGTPAQIMDPIYATNAFLDHLIQVPNWQTIPLTVAAQAVQGSGFPNAYAQWQTMAQDLVGQMWATATGGAPPAGSPMGPAGRGQGPTASPPDCGGDGAISGGDLPLPADLHVRGTPAGQAAVRYALAQLGKPYRWGGQGPDSYDCSGLTMAAWAAAGVAIPRTSQAQASAGTPEPLTLVTARSGDLVFIPGADGTPAAPGHVAMVAGWVEKPDGPHLLLVQAPHTGAVVTLTDVSTWRGQVVAVRHIG